MPNALIRLPFLRRAGVLAGLACALLAGPALAASALEARIEAEARAWLLAASRDLGVTAPRIALTIVPPARLVPPCAGLVQLQVVDGSRMDRLRVAVRCPGTDAAPDLYAVRASVTAPVVVLQAQVPAGKVLTEAMLGLAEHDLALVPDALSDPAGAVGRSSRRSLRSGQVLQERFLHSEAGIRRGQVVRIVAGRDGFEVSIAGIALQDGAPDAMVTVRNQSTGRIVPARVVGDGVVRLAAAD